MAATTRRELLCTALAGLAAGALGLELAGAREKPRLEGNQQLASFR
jgi:hypothetical protein